MGKISDPVNPLIGRSAAFLRSTLAYPIRVIAMKLGLLSIKVAADLRAGILNISKFGLLQMSTGFSSR